MKLLTILAFCGIILGAYYDEGEQVSTSHQNITKSTCYSGNDYENGDSWKLADWNGATNGGHYNVIFIEMSATW